MSSDYKAVQRHKTAARLLLGNAMALRINQQMDRAWAENVQRA